MQLFTYKGTVSILGMLDIAVMLVWRAMNISKVAFIVGSSKQGNALLASVGSNWVAASHLKFNISNLETNIKVQQKMYPRKRSKIKITHFISHM